MKRTLLLCLAVTIFQNASAQFTSSSQTLTDDLNTIDRSMEHKLGKKGAGNNISCNGDTIDYARYKATALVGINISNGYRLGQYYETPGEVTVSGFDLYAWQNMGTAAVVEVYCQLYEAGADSLPSGSPIREDTIYVDSTFGGTLTTVAHRAVFSSPYKASKPYILVVSTDDTNRVAVVTNSYDSLDGLGEDLGCGTVGGRWYKFSALNIGGTTLDCDVLLEPHVGYDVFNDFSFKDCYDYRDTVRFGYESSPFFESRVYNRYKFRNWEQYCHRWDFYGTGSSLYMVLGKFKYSSSQNYRVRLISTQYHYRGGGRCIDTVYRDLSFQPDEIQFNGDKRICSGQNAIVNAIANAEVEWSRSPSDTAAFLTGFSYETSKPLESNDTVYAKAVNRTCESNLKRYIIEVTTTPNTPTIINDSICLNSYANLTAKSNTGIIRWYADSTTPNPVYTGEVLQIGPLNRDTFFFAKAQNGACTHPGRLRATAFVSNEFAPMAPTVSNDTTICLLSEPLILRASSTNTLRWYAIAAGGSVISTGDTIVFNPQSRGEHRRYVDAYDGNCASSRLPIVITVNHFPELTGLSDISGCAGDTIQIDLSTIHGGLDWYDSITGGNTIYSGKSRVFESISSDQTFYLEPYEGYCHDSIRHAFKVESIPFGKVVTKQLDTTACDGLVPTLEVQSDVGIVKWYDETLDSLLHQGNKLSLEPVTGNRVVHYQIDNKGCITEPVRHEVKWLLMPDANFDYQVVWRNVDFASRLIGQGTYVWNFGDGSDTLMGTDVKHYYPVDDVYEASLIVTTPFECADTVIKEITINAVGIDERSQADINLYPNPVQKNGILHISPATGWTKYTLYDLVGREIYVHKAAPGDIEFELVIPNLSTGTYYLKLSGDKSEILLPFAVANE